MRTMPSQAYWGKVSDWSCLDFGWKSFDLSLISVPQASPISSSRYHHWSPWIPHPSFVPVTSASQIYNSLVRNSGAFDGCSCRNCTWGGLCHIWCTPPLAPGAPSHCLLIHVTKCSHCGKQNPVQLLLSFGLAARTSKWWAEKRIIFQDWKPEVKTCLAASSLSAEGVQARMEMGKPGLA